MAKPLYCLAKRSRGAAAVFTFQLEDNLLQLQEDLAAESYRPSHYTSFTIREPKTTYQRGPSITSESPVLF